jgi:predicted RNase H-like HicB family nuclease
MIAVRKNEWTKEFLLNPEIKFYRETSSWIVAECPELPGCVSQGKTEAEAMENIREAIAGWLWAEDLKQSEANL